MVETYQQKFKRLIDILVFKDLPISKKFQLFSAGTLFWLVVMAGIGFVTMVEMNAKSQWIVDVIEPHQRTGHIFIRKLRGISISAHKIALSNDKYVINNNYLKAKARIEDIKAYCDVLVRGGQIKDYSRGTGQFYSEFAVMSLRDEAKIAQVEGILQRVERLDQLIDAIADDKLSGLNTAVLDRLSEIDLLIRDTVTVTNEYIISLDKEWRLFSDIIKTRLGWSIALTIVIFVLAFTMSGLFGTLIARALSGPINRLKKQIESLSAGELDLKKKLAVPSKDEIGELTRQFNRLIETIHNVTNFKKVVEEDETLNDIYLRLGNVFIDYLKLESCVIYEISETGKMMHVVYPPEAEGVELNCSKEIYNDCELCRVKRTGHIVSSIDYPNICKYYLEGANKTHVCLPIIVGGAVSGVVQLTCKQLQYCDLEDLRNKISRVQQYVREIQPVLEAKKLMKVLKDSSIRDALTGLYNRRFLEESFEKLVSATLRRGTVLGLLMCDLDYFKQVNDILGHDAGDTVLRETASVIQRTVRSSDLVIRFGGEEFLVIVVDAKEGAAVLVAEKIRQRIEENKIQIRTEVLQKTISIGVSEFPTDTENFWEAIKYADVALYKAKEAGRNRVVHFESSMWGQESY
jgi:diguanylate cyclase (GGDEF)-like protein